MVLGVRRDCKVNEESLLAALGRVPRHLFVPEKNRNDAYQNRPVALASGQTLPQACVSAQMIALLGLYGGEKVLEIGTGSGYDSALLSQLAATGRHHRDRPRHRQPRPAPVARASATTTSRCTSATATAGCRKRRLFDAILVTAAPRRFPSRSSTQLAVGGKMVVAVGYSLYQDLQVITKDRDAAAARSAGSA